MSPVNTDHFSAYSIQIYPYMNQQTNFHTLQTRTWWMSTVLSQKLLIWFHPFKQGTYILVRRPALWRSSQHINTLTASHFPIFYSGLLRLPCWQIHLIKLSFYQITDFYSQKCFLSLPLFSFSTHTRLHPPNTLTTLHCRSRAQGASIHSHHVVIWIVFHGP